MACNVSAVTFEKNFQHHSQNNQQDDNDCKHGADKKPAAWFWGKRQKKKLESDVTILPLPGDSQYCIPAIMPSNHSPSTIRMKLFLISTFRDLWETLHVNCFPESLREAVR